MLHGCTLIAEHPRCLCYDELLMLQPELGEFQ